MALAQGFGTGRAGERFGTAVALQCGDAAGMIEMRM
jgi:hypothetical protein